MPNSSPRTLGRFRRRFDAPRYSSVKPSPELFDGQAQAFDGRAGLSQRSAARLPRWCSSSATSARLSSSWRLVPAPDKSASGSRRRGAISASIYRTGCCNVSARGRARRRRACLLLRADANRSWPLTAGAARVIFSSRALHLLEHEHVADEVFRVGQPAGATLIIGRVERPQGVSERGWPARCARDCAVSDSTRVATTSIAGLLTPACSAAPCCWSR